MTPKRVITYGTFDLLHPGHINILRRAKEMAEGGDLYVGLSSDNFNKLKGKKSALNYEQRKQVLEAIKYVDFVFPENDWSQKVDDIVNKYHADIFVMGGDWEGKFDELKQYCEVRYLPRTAGISTTEIKAEISK